MLGTTPVVKGQDELPFSALTLPHKVAARAGLSVGQDKLCGVGTGDHAVEPRKLDQLAKVLSILLGDGPGGVGMGGRGGEPGRHTLNRLKLDKDPVVVLLGVVRLGVALLRRGRGRGEGVGFVSYVVHVGFAEEAHVSRPGRRLDGARGCTSDAGIVRRVLLTTGENFDDLGVSVPRITPRTICLLSVRVEGGAESSEDGRRRDGGGEVGECASEWRTGRAVVFLPRCVARRGAVQSGEDGVSRGVRTPNESITAGEPLLCSTDFFFDVVGPVCAARRRGTRCRAHLAGGRWGELRTASSSSSYDDATGAAVGELSGERGGAGVQGGHARVPATPRPLRLRRVCGVEGDGMKSGGGGVLEAVVQVTGTGGGEGVARGTTPAVGARGRGDDGRVAPIHCGPAVADSCCCRGKGADGGGGGGQFAQTGQ